MLSLQELLRSQREWRARARVADRRSAASAFRVRNCSRCVRAHMTRNDGVYPMRKMATVVFNKALANSLSLTLTQRALPEQTIFVTSSPVVTTISISAVSQGVRGHPSNRASCRHYHHSPPSSSPHPPLPHPPYCSLPALLPLRLRLLLLLCEVQRLEQHKKERE